MLLSDPPVTSRESWDVTMIELFPGGNTSALGGFFPRSEGEDSENPKITEVFPARKTF
jgi:hypothetical protein